jgi:DMSO/TMAO reductase YedYZ molybdopterin-dependent catalytic subunit
MTDDGEDCIVQRTESLLRRRPDRRRRMPSRITNLTVLVALLAVFATGAGAVATGSVRGRWIVFAHGVVAALLVALIPAKGRVIRAGLRRARRSRWISLLLSVLVVATIVAGVVHSTGLLRSLAGLPILWFHVALALLLVPFACWHVVARRVRPRRSDVSRRTVLRAGGLVAASAALYGTVTALTGLAGLAGARRRFTGSYETASLQPAALPQTIWLADAVPQVDPGRWRLVVADAVGRYELALQDVTRFSARRRALLDCTSGWYSVQDWEGAPVRALVRGTGDARSLLVGSMTGYWVRLPLTDLDELLLAHSVGDGPLSPGHGFPLRLVAPGRRGYWWVKWVDRIELSTDPWWWQPPFPVT